MLGQLAELVLPRIIGVMVHKLETLTEKERAAQETLMSRFHSIPKHKTEKPLIVAMIGLIGSGKTSVARELAKHIGATVIEGDEIRIELRKRVEIYERARAIAENMSLEIVNQGGNVVLDSDFIDAKKRASLREKARKAGIRVVFVRTYTTDFDTVAGRIIMASYSDQANDFFGSASSRWKGSEQSKGAVVKMRELWRRTPQHYRWQNKVGGQWLIKNPPCILLADIDTTNRDEWKREVKKIAQELLKK